MLPCGTPVFTDNIEEARLLSEVYCLWLVKYKIKRSNATLTNTIVFKFIQKNLMIYGIKRFSQV